MKNKSKLGEEKKEALLNSKMRSNKTTLLKRDQRESIDLKVKGKNIEEEEEVAEEAEGEEEEEGLIKEKKMEMMKVSSKFKIRARIKEEEEAEEEVTEEITEAIEEEQKEVISKAEEVVSKENITEEADHRLLTKKNLRLKKATPNDKFFKIFENRKLMYL
jgi:hypothetical protein